MRSIRHFASGLIETKRFMCRSISFRSLRRLIYFFITVYLALFVFQQGLKPWIVVAERWPAVCVIVVVSVLGYLVQAASFRACLPEPKSLNTTDLIRIWTTAGVVALITPVVAGFATRAVLLHDAGVGFKVTAAATIRQGWFGLQYSLLTTALVFLLFPWSFAPTLGWTIFIFWISIWATPKILAFHTVTRWRTKLPAWLVGFAEPIPMWSRLLFIAQLLLMSSNYFAAFNYPSLKLSPQECILLASVTVIISVIGFVPNGLGILDALWFWLAQHQGMDTPQSVAIALVLRVGNLIAAITLSAGLSVGRRTANKPG